MYFDETAWVAIAFLLFFVLVWKKGKKAMGTAAKLMAKKGMGTAGKLTAKQKKLPDFLKEKILKSKKK